MTDVKHMNTEEWPNTLIGEILLLGLINKSLQSYPDIEWLQSLIDEDIFSESPLGEEQPEIQAGMNYLQKWAEANKKGISEKSYQDLKLDFTRLFIGLGEPLAPVWESTYFNPDRLVFQEQTIEVRNWYRRFGLETEKLHKEPDDHIGLELSFIANLSSQALEALEMNDEIKFNALIQSQEEFLSEHTMRWAMQWCSLVDENAQTDFYRGIGLLTKGALSLIAQQRGLLIPQETSK